MNIKSPFYSSRDFSIYFLTLLWWSGWPNFSNFSTCWICGQNHLTLTMLTQKNKSYQKNKLLQVLCQITLLWGQNFSQFSTTLFFLYYHDTMAIKKILFLLFFFVFRSKSRYYDDQKNQNLHIFCDTFFEIPFDSLKSTVRNLLNWN